VTPFLKVTVWSKHKHNQIELKVNTASLRADRIDISIKEHDDAIVFSEFEKMKREKTLIIEIIVNHSQKGYVFFQLI
jgi:hypothetical protein